MNAAPNLLFAGRLPPHAHAASSNLDNVTSGNILRPSVGRPEPHQQSDCTIVTALACAEVCPSAYVQSDFGICPFTRGHTLLFSAPKSHDRPPLILVPGVLVSPVVVVFFTARRCGTCGGDRCVGWGECCEETIQVRGEMCADTEVAPCIYNKGE